MDEHNGHGLAPNDQATPSPLGSQNDVPEVDFHPHSVEAITRDEGYREFRCVPATWSYAGKRPFGELLTEYYSQRIDADERRWLAESTGFWSGSDAAVRLRRISAGDLDLRELASLSTRRSTGINAYVPWLAQPELQPLATKWESDATDIHFSQVDLESEDDDEEDEDRGLWAHYGMELAPDLRVVTGYYMQASRRPRPARVGAWQGAPGAWHTWSNVVQWDGWLRRQDAPAPVPTSAADEYLRLFVSHRWESLDHPDPNGSQLLALNVGLTLSLAAALVRTEGDEPTQSGLPELIYAFLNDADPSLCRDSSLREWAAAVRTTAEAASSEGPLWMELQDLESAHPARDAVALLRERILIWYDYTSMFQVPRTPGEEAAFRREILELNAIQAQAATLVLAGAEGYASRAWCFLELCGGMRHEIVEIVPSWGHAVGIGQDAPRWASRSDQLIGALNMFGPEALRSAGLEAANEGDFVAIAALLRDLPLIGMVETDDSDLVGGVMPLPRRDGGWVVAVGERPPTQTMTLPVVDSFGILPPAALLASAPSYAEADSLAGPVGVWVYTTQRMLSLAWAIRAPETWVAVAQTLREQDGDLLGLVNPSAKASVACMWADPCALADDGLGWTRIVPSTVELLIVITQADLPPICPIYDTVVDSHLDSGVPVVTFMPDSGHLTVHTPSAQGSERQQPKYADVRAAARIRRSDAYVRKMLIDPSTGRDTLELQAALRLEPGEGSPTPGRVSKAVANAGLGQVGAEISATEMLSYCERRVRVEALARCVAATWEEWFDPRLDASAWSVGMAPSQLDVIERLVRATHAGFDNPFKRRRLLRVLLERHEGYALPPRIVDDATDLILKARDDPEALLRPVVHRPPQGQPPRGTRRWWWPWERRRSHR